MLDPAALALAVSSLIVALALMERVAARAMRVRNDAWHRHYQRVPKHATVVADCAWTGRNWVTAFCEAPSPGEEPTFRFISAAPLAEEQSAACHRWLQAEGFDPVGSVGPGDQRASFESSFPA